MIIIYTGIIVCSIITVYVFIFGLFMSFTKPTKTSLTNAIITHCETSECNRVNITWEVNGKKYSESNVKINEKDKKVKDKIQIYYDKSSPSNYSLKKEKNNVFVGTLIQLGSLIMLYLFVLSAIISKKSNTAAIIFSVVYLLLTILGIMFIVLESKILKNWGNFLEA